MRLRRRDLRRGKRDSEERANDEPYLEDIRANEVILTDDAPAALR